MSVRLSFVPLYGGKGAVAKAIAGDHALKDVDVGGDVKGLVHIEHIELLFKAAYQDIKNSFDILHGGANVCAVAARVFKAAVGLKYLYRFGQIFFLEAAGVLLFFGI